MRHPIIAALVAAGALGALTGCSAPTTADAGPTAPSSAAPATSAAPAAKPEAVEYRVTGTGKVTISYVVGSGSEQVTATKSWSKVAPLTDDFYAYSLVASAGTAGAKVSCEIIENGKSISKHSSSGDYATVTCSGTRKI